MNDLKELQNRIDNDNDAMRTAFSDLISIVSYNEEGNYNEPDEESLNAAINEVIDYLGVKMKVEEVPGEINDLNAKIEYILRPTGIMRRRVELTGSWWKDSSGVLLGSTKKGEVVSLLPAFPSGYTFYDNDLGKRVRINKNNADRINKDAFCFYRALPAKKLSLADLGLFAFHSIKQRDIILVIVASLFVSLLGMLTPFINKQIFDVIIPSGIKSNVFPLAVLLVGVTIGIALFRITQGMILMQLRDKINLSVVSAIMARIFALPVTFFKNFSAGELSARVTNINTLCSILSDTILSTLLTALFSFIYIFQMVNFAPPLVLPGLIIIFSMLIFTILLGIVQQGLFEKETKVSVKMNGLVFGLFSGVQKVKLAGAEKRAFAKWASAYKEMGNVTYSPPILLRIKEAVSGTFVFGGMIILYYFAVMHNVSVSDYIAFSIAYGMISGSIISLGGVIPTFANIKPLLEMIKPILEAVPEIDKSKKQVASFEGNIEMSNIKFRYSEDEPLVIDNISLKIKAGEYVAIVGSSGSGKSTLMRLLLGFEKPESGAIYYDGNDIENLDVRTVRQNIGTCLQNGKLFSGDIFSNIIVSTPWSTLDDAWKAARMAGLEDDIKSMPMGMYTIISEGSGSISGGQRQRILIARALISNPKILLFDEATSALDNITQKIVADSIAALGCTRVVIAHRLSTVINCDRIIVLDKGKVSEEGTYNELMNKKGLFYEFAQRQIV